MSDSRRDEFADDDEDRGKEEPHRGNFGPFLPRDLFAAGRALDDLNKSVLRHVRINVTDDVLKQFNESLRPLGNGVLHQLTQTAERVRLAYQSPLVEVTNTFREMYEARLTSLIEPLTSFVGEAARSLLNTGKMFEVGKRMREALDRARAPNWPEDIDIAQLGDLIEETGWPLVWVPRSEIVQELVDAPDHPARQLVLLSHKNEILEDVCSRAWEVTDSELVAFVPAIGQASNALHAGMPAASQALSAVILTDLLATCECHRLASAREKLPWEWKETGLRTLRLALIGRTVVDALSRFYREDDDAVPDKFNRHASAHTISEVQYTEANAIVGLMMVGSFVRELEQLANEGLA